MESAAASGTGIHNKAKMAEFALLCKRQREAKQRRPARQVLNKLPEVEVLATDGALSREGALCDRLIRKYLPTTVSRLFPNDEGISNKVIYDEEGKRLASTLRGGLRGLYMMNSLTPSRRKSKSYLRKVKKIKKLIEKSLVEWKRLVGESASLKKRDVILGDRRFGFIYEKRQTEFFIKYLKPILLGYTSTTEAGACNVQDLVERIGVCREKYLHTAGTKLITVINGSTNYIPGKKGRYERLMSKISAIRQRVTIVAESAPGSRAEVLKKCCAWETVIDGFVSIQSKKALHIQVIQGIVDNRKGVTPFDESRLFERSLATIASIFETWLTFANDERSIIDAVSEISEIL